MKTFTHAGVSRLNGEFKFRVANGSSRVKVLMQNGHTDIDLVEMIRPMTKEEAVDYLLSIDFDNGRADVRAALDAEKQRWEPKPEKAVRKPRAKKEQEPAQVEAQPKMQDIVADIEEIDEQSQVISADFDLATVEDALF